MACNQSWLAKEFRVGSCQWREQLGVKQLQSRQSACLHRSLHWTPLAKGWCRARRAARACSAFGSIYTIYQGLSWWQDYCGKCVCLVEQTATPCLVHSEGRFATVAGEVRFEWLQ